MNKTTEITLIELVKFVKMALLKCLQQNDHLDECRYEFCFLCDTSKPFSQM